MPFPAGITTCTMQFGQALSSLGNVALITGRVTNDRRLVYDNRTIFDVPDDITSTNGVLLFDYPHTNQDGFATTNGQPITDWAGELEYTVIFENGETKTGTKPLQPLLGDTFIDLDNVPDDTPLRLPVVADYQRVLSVGGRTGVITREQLAEDLEGLVGGGGSQEVVPASNFGSNFIASGQRLGLLVLGAGSFFEADVAAGYWEAAFPAAVRPRSNATGLFQAKDAGGVVLGFCTATIYTDGSVYAASMPEGTISLDGIGLHWFTAAVAPDDGGDQGGG